MHTYSCLVLLVMKVNTTGNANGEETLEELVLFWTGYPSLPPDVTTKIYVKYPENNPDKVLAESSTFSL